MYNEPNSTVSKFMKQKLIEWKEKQTHVIGYFNTSFLVVDRTSRQKIRKGIKDLSNATNQLDLWTFIEPFIQQ